MTKLKIASFAYRSYPAKGGVEYHQKLISQYFHEKGYDVDIYTSRTENNSEFMNIDLKFPFFHFPQKKSQLKYAETIDGINYKRFDIKFRFYSYNQMKSLYETFEKEIKKYDIIHLHGLNVYNNYRLAKIAHKNGIPVVMTCHDTIIADSYPLLIKWLKKIYDTKIIRKLDKHVDYFILNTSDQIADLTKAGISIKKIGVIPVGLDTETLPIEKKNEEKILKKYSLLNKDYLFNIGRIEEYKGIQDIIYVAKKLPDIQFIVAGKDQGYLKQLKEISSKTNVKNVMFIGEVSNSEKNILIKNAKVFLFPSKREGWGIVMVEAMALGTPCIAYNTKNVRTVFTNYKSGILINKKEGLEKAILYLLDNKVRKEYSKNGLHEAKKYDYRNLFPKIDSVFHKLIIE